MKKRTQKLEAAAERTSPPAVPSLPESLRATLERLRQETLDAGDFALPFSTFHTQLARDRTFRAACVRSDDPELRRAIEAVARRVDPACACGRSVLLRVGDFTHGLFESSAGHLVVYYFEREDVGLLGFVENPRGPLLVRFSCALSAAPAAEHTPQERPGARSRRN